MNRLLAPVKTLLENWVIGQTWEVVVRVARAPERVGSQLGPRPRRRSRRSWEGTWKPRQHPASWIATSCGGRQSRAWFESRSIKIGLSYSRGEKSICLSNLALRISEKRWLLLKYSSFLFGYFPRKIVWVPSLRKPGNAESFFISATNADVTFH